MRGNLCERLSSLLLLDNVITVDCCEREFSIKCHAEVSLSSCAHLLCAHRGSASSKSSFPGSFVLRWQKTEIKAMMMMIFEWGRWSVARSFTSL